MNPNHIGTNFDDFLKEEGIMTDNITRLYELAGVEKKGGCPRYCNTVPHHNCKICKYKDEIHWYYPPFTAEKQLELIKWVATKQGYITISYDSDYGYDCEVVNNNDCYASFCYYEPEYALCGLIIDLWKDLTEEQKAEIKEILK